MITPSQNKQPPGLMAISAFFLGGGALATLAGVTLLFPGTFLNVIWVLNPAAYAEMAPHGKLAGALFLVLGLLLALAGIGWLKRRFWGWCLGTALIAVNLAGDATRFALGNWLEGGVGILIAGLLLIYMTGPRMRSWFRSERQSGA
jgi:hypothetical protein